MSQERNNSAAIMQQLDDRIDLRDISFTLYANRWLILATAIIGLFVGVIVLSRQVPTYTSNLLLQTDTSGMSSLSVLDTKALLGASAAASPEDIETVLIKSRYILAPVVQTLGLDFSVSQEYFPVFGAWYAAHHKTLSKPFLGLSQYAWGGEKLKITQFTVPSTEEQQHFTLQVGPSVNEYSLYDAHEQLILRGKVGQQASAIVPGRGLFALQVSELVANPNMRFFIDKKSMQHIVAELASQISVGDLLQGPDAPKSGIFQVNMTGTDPRFIVSVLNAVAQVAVEKDVQRKTSEAIKTLDFLNQQLPLVKSSLESAENQLNAYRAKSGKIDLGLQSKLLLSQISSVQQQIEVIKMEKAESLQKYTAQHPYVLALDNKQQVLQNEFDSLQKRASTLPSGDQTAVSLMRDVRVKSQLYMILLNRMQSFQVMKAGTVSDLRVLGLAEMPTGPNPAKKGVILLAGFVVGFALGIVIVFVRKTLYSKISDPNWIESQFEIPNMAIIPHSKEQDLIVSMQTGKTTLQSLLAQIKPKDLSVEALRSLRTSLQFAMMDAANNVISIMGIAPQVGKSFISANFAYLMANAGKKVLLIDGDIRKGHLKNYFQVDATKGLSDVIVGNANFEEVVIKGPLEKLDFLATGPYPPNPSELLMNHRFKELIDSVSKKYDLVIIDTAPILAVTDGAIIGHYAATNFIVLASGVHEAGEVELALKRLSTNGIKLDGAIFNFAKMQKIGHNHHSYKYGYNYQYKYE